MLKQESKHHSSDIFNQIATSMWLEDLSEVYLALDKLREDGVTDIRDHIERHPDFSSQLASSVKVLDVNKATLELFEAQSRKGFLETIQNSFGEGALDIFEQSLEYYWNKSETFEARTNFITETGREFPANICIYPPKSLEESKLIYVTITDISQAVKHEQQLNAIASTLPDLTLIFGRDGTTLDVLSNREELLYRKREIVLGQKLQDVIPGETGTRLLHTIEQTFVTGNQQLIEYELDIQGKSHWFEANVAALPELYDGKEAVVWIARDISARKLLEKQILHAQKAEALGSLSGNLAHEFNNLLAPIIGYSDLLKSKHQLDEFCNRAVSQISQSSLRASNLIKQLVAYGGQSQHILELIELNHLLSEVMESIRSTAPDSLHIEVMYCLSSVYIEANRQEVKELIHNLCNNALEAMPDGGTLSINLSKEANDNDNLTVVMTVSDTGIGIPEQNIEKVYEPFYSTKPVGSGTGMGLSVVQGIVHQYQGEIAITSAVNQGTNVIVTLPIADIEQQSQVLQPQVVPTDSPQILVVDDDLSVQQLLGAMLSHLGFRAEFASLANESIKMLTEQHYDLLICEYQLADMTGIELISRCREEYTNLKFALLSDYTSKSFLDEHKIQNDLTVLEKPFELDSLKSVLLKSGFNPLVD